METKERFDLVFETLVTAAIAKERCPTNEDIRNKFRERGHTWGREKFTFMPPSAVTKLAEQGKIQVEIYAVNWRVIQIMEGPYLGSRTKECPHGGVPYKIFKKKPAEQVV